jgi:hypothetical protein
MTASKVDNPMPPVQCTPWCEEGDGHPNEAFREDQKCWSPAEYVDLSLHEAESDEDFSQSVGVMARRNDAGTVVYVHLRDIKQPYDGIPFPYNYLDMSLHLTAEEAERIAGALLEVAKLVRARDG